MNTYAGDAILAEGYGFDGMGDTASLTSPGGFANMNPTERKNWGAQGIFDCSCCKPPLSI